MAGPGNRIHKITHPVGKSRFTSHRITVTFWPETNLNVMQKPASFLGAVLLVGVLVSGCAGPEKKFGRGMNNLFEIVRMGDMRRTVEQTALFESSDTAYGTGFFRGLNRSLARTGVGIYEVVTFPIPSYDPVWTSYLTPNPVYPDSYKPRLMEDSTFATDTHIGFSGGDVAPFIPGSRFHVFDN